MSFKGLPIADPGGAASIRCEMKAFFQKGCAGMAVTTSKEYGICTNAFRDPKGGETFITIPLPPVLAVEVSKTPKVKSKSFMWECCNEAPAGH